MKTHLTSFFAQFKIELIAFSISIASPTVTNLFFVGLLIFIDTLSGVWAAKKNGGWKVVQSRRLSDGLIPKLILYPFIIIIGSACQHLFPEIPFLKGATFILMAIELKSISENITKILGINFLNFAKAFVLKGKRGLFDEINKEENGKTNVHE